MNFLNSMYETCCIGVDTVLFLYRESTNKSILESYELSHLNLKK